MKNSGQSISIEKAAGLLGVTVEELQQLSDSGKIKSHRTAYSSHLRFILEDLQSMYRKKYQSPGGITQPKVLADALLAELENN